MAKFDTSGFTYRPRANTETALLHSILMANPEVSRDQAVALATKAGIDEGKAKSWIRGLVNNGNAPGRFPNGVQNVPNDKERNKVLAGGQAAPAKAKRGAAKGRKAK